MNSVESMNSVLQNTAMQIVTDLPASAHDAITSGITYSLDIYPVWLD